MSLFQTTGAGGDPAWIDPTQVIALESIYTDRTLHGEADDAKLLTRVYLRSGANIELDADIKVLAQQIEDALK